MKRIHAYLAVLVIVGLSFLLPVSADAGGPSQFGTPTGLGMDVDPDICPADVQLVAQPGQPVAKTVSRSNERLKVSQVDARQGLVTAQVVRTGEIVRFTAPPAALKRQELRAGGVITFAFIRQIGGAHGNCACGQRADGSCWCVSDVPACCGPLHGCPMASCDKKQPIPGAGGIETQPSSPGGPR